MKEERFTIEPIWEIGADLRALVSIAEAEGHAFMKRLLDAWEQGANRFDLPGEAYFVVRDGSRVVAAGGLNRDPYCSDPGVGRVRHVYVDPATRRSGAGTSLMGRIVAVANPQFIMLRLRTNTPQGAAFYEALGFEPNDTSDASHVLRF